MDVILPSGLLPISLLVIYPHCSLLISSWATRDSTSQHPFAGESTLSPTAFNLLPLHFTTIMTSHAHFIRSKYRPEDLFNRGSFLNWICPVKNADTTITAAVTK